jgi:hypothetical protein
MNLTLAQYHLRTNAHTTLCELMVHPDEKLLRAFFDQLREFLRNPESTKSTRYSIDTRNLGDLFLAALPRPMGLPEYSKRVILLAQNFDLITHGNNLCIHQSLVRGNKVRENLRYFHYTMLVNLWTHFLPTREWEDAFFAIWKKYSPECSGVATNFSFNGATRNCRRVCEVVASHIQGSHSFEPARLRWLIAHNYPFSLSYAGGHMTPLKVQLKPTLSKFKTEKSACPPPSSAAPTGVKPARAISLDPANCFYLTHRMTLKDKKNVIVDWAKTQPARDLLLTNAILIYFNQSPKPSPRGKPGEEMLNFAFLPLIKALRNPSVLIRAMQAYRKVYPRILLYSSPDFDLRLTEAATIVRKLESLAEDAKDLDMAIWEFMGLVQSIFPHSKRVARAYNAAMAACTFRALA